MVYIRRSEEIGVVGGDYVSKSQEPPRLQEALPEKQKLMEFFVLVLLGLAFRTFRFQHRAVRHRREEGRLRHGVDSLAVGQISLGIVVSQLGEGYAL
jgi:hypothetical protein